MTDKDPKEMTASEQLRWAANGEPYNGIDENIWTYPTGKIRALAEAVTGEWPSDNEIFSIVADKIDAELAQARELSLRQGAELWAKANGWPDFKDGEGFGAWLERCALPRPRFEDGEPVQFGDEPLYLETIDEIDFYQDGTVTIGHDGNTFEVDPGEGVKRPAPEVLGADGLPLNEDDTVYGTGREQHRYTVQVPYSINEEVGKRFCVQCYDHDEGNITWCDPSMLTHERPVLGADGLPIKVGETVWLTDEGNAHIGSVNFKAGPRSHGLCGVEVGEPLTVLGIKPKVRRNDHRFVAFDHPASPWCDALWLTHTPPETQERIDDDATMPPAEYCAVRGIDLGDDPDRETAITTMVRDLLRRQREYDKRTGGAE